MKGRPGAYEKKVKAFFSNSVLIVDEAHNIKDTNKDKQIPKILEEVFKIKQGNYQKKNQYWNSFSIISEIKKIGQDRQLSSKITKIN